ncbi:hypothetical protein EPN83_03065 [Patescibacteria group bacterium]|nr:MAG: hypothetical protein EPN83_03065 [Patescibacteria group bacterium]
MFERKGKLIVLEGTDGSGKATQSKLLLRALQRHLPATLFEFPRYKRSEFGRLIRRSLSGEFGDFLRLSPYLSSLPYMLDRARALPLLLEALKEGHVICDRYTTSNIAYQAAKLKPLEHRKFISFVENAEYHELGLPTPDVVLFLWVPPRVSRKLLAKREHSRNVAPDQHELEYNFQRSVIKMYTYLAATNPNWRVVRCVDGHGRVLSRDTIHAKVMNVLRRTLKLK